MRARRLCALAIALSASLAQAQEPEKTYPRRMSGAEIETHFKEIWSADGVTSRANRVNMYNNADGTFTLHSNMGTSQNSIGKRTIKVDEGQVCLDMGTTVWRGATDCYRVFQTGPNAYSMRSVSNNFRFDYRR